MEKPNQAPHIVIVPTPGIGHIIPLVQLAHHLITNHNFTISFIIPTAQSPPSTAQNTILSTLPTTHCDYFYLPPVSLDDLPCETKIEMRIALTLTRSKPDLRARLGDVSRSHNAVIVIVDMFGTECFELCWEFKFKPYMFYLCNAMCLSFSFHLPELDRVVLGEYRDMVEPVRLPGCVPVYGKDLVDPVQDRMDEVYKHMLVHIKRFHLAEGILVNTFNELEEETIKALQQPGSGNPPVYPVGPLVQIGSSERVEGFKCLKWLDEQPRGSVLFVCFGSGGTLSSDQIIELAHGLEMSEHKFLWVVKVPNDKISNATFFDSDQVIDENNDPLAFLPKGFIERTKGLGLVIPSWAPQIAILSHESTGGFLTHCGWNSILESVVYGVPLIAWPLYAEQKMNAVLLTDGLKVALRPVVNETGLVSRGEIRKVIKELMEGVKGKEMRNKMKELKGVAAKVLNEDGSSTKALEEVALKWRSH